MNNIANKILELTRAQESTSNELPFPANGNMNEVNTYVNSIKDWGSGNPEFYRTYLDHMKYFIGLFKFMKDKEIERLNHVIFRQLIEFGKVAITSVKDKKTDKNKYLISSIVKLEHNEFFEYTKITGMPVRKGGSVINNVETVILPPERTVVIFSNFDGFPFMYFWRDILTTILKLKKTAVNGSILSMKKLKYNLNNSSDEIINKEVSLLLNPDVPFITNITSPASYFRKREQLSTGNNINEPSREQGNDMILDTTSDVSSLWTNLKEYVEFEYLQKGRRVNTNKKKERNIAGEIDTETINFDILDQELKSALEEAVIEMNDKFGTSLELFSIVETQIDDVENEGNENLLSNENKNIKKEGKKWNFLGR